MLNLWIRNERYYDDVIYIWKMMLSEIILFVIIKDALLLLAQFCLFDRTVMWM